MSSTPLITPEPDGVVESGSGEGSRSSRFGDRSTRGDRSRKGRRRNKSLKDVLVPPPSGEAALQLDDSVFGAGKYEYYRRQREEQEAVGEMEQLLAEDALQPAGEMVADVEDQLKQHRLRDEQTRGDKLAVSISNWLNICLFFLKLYASMATRSLAVIASTLDSLLDILAGAILWYTAVTMAHHDPEKYPIGKRRMQPVGIIIFAAIMATLGFQILVEGISSILAGKPESQSHVSSAVLHWVLVLLALVIVVKLVLFLMCRSSHNDIVQAYATDHFLDMMTNGVAFVAALLGSKVAWWVDPAGAMIIAVYTIVNWSRTVLENAESLIGVSASPELLAKIVEVSLTHDARISRVISLRAWLLGSQYMVEVDVELPGEMTLKEAHGIGESLQKKLEAMLEVDRAFVHLDYREPSQRIATAS